MRPPQPNPEFDAWLGRIDSEIHSQLAQHLHTPGSGQTPSPTSRISILLIDDHALMRLSLRAVLEVEPDIKVIGEAGDNREALAKVAELQPDLVLLDITTPGPDSVEAITAIKNLAPATRIVMLSASESGQDLYEAVKAGADGFLLKDALPCTIADSLRTVASGHFLISPPTAMRLLTELTATPDHASRDSTNAGPSAPGLTVREVDVLRLISTGANMNMITSRLFISENTVNNHVRNILEKLRLRSRMQAMTHSARPDTLDVQ
jgi:two-component system NarL family response regulator